jgi:hypothetical protein
VASRGRRRKIRLGLMFCREQSQRSAATSTCWGPMSHSTKPPDGGAGRNGRRQPQPVGARRMSHSPCPACPVATVGGNLNLLGHGVQQEIVDAARLVATSTCWGSTGATAPCRGSGTSRRAVATSTCWGGRWSRIAPLRDGHVTTGCGHSDLLGQVAELLDELAVARLAAQRAVATSTCWGVNSLRPRCKPVGAEPHPGVPLNGPSAKSQRSGQIRPVGEIWPIAACSATGRHNWL